jgi:4-alpha-glucanotransferase
MRIHFLIRFHTRPGQSLSLSGNIPELGNDNVSDAFPLTYLNNEFWSGTIEADPNKIVKIRYQYNLHQPDGTIVPEWGHDRLVDISKSALEEIRLIDTWNHAGEYENVFYTDPFQNTLLQDNDARFRAKPSKHFNHIFRVKAPLLRKNEVICMLGNIPELNSWDISNPLLMGKDHHWWSLKLSLPASDIPVFYKYGVFNIREKKFVRFEAGDNRSVKCEAGELKLTVVHDGFVHLPNDTWKGAGVNIPVFSLRSKNSFGVGEFNDLKLLVDWAKECGLKLIQILPVNDTIATHTWTDSYPYACISAFALHPLYLNLESMAGKDGSDQIRALRKKQRQLNELDEVDYEQVLKFKLSTAKELYLGRKTDLFDDKEFNEFFEKNRHWLVPYAAFSYLRDRNGTSDFTRWKIYSRYDQSAIEKYVSRKAKHFDNIAIHYFIQFHLHLQLKDAVDYAHKNGIIIKGDIPIGIHRFGCDAWVEPDLYHMEFQAGAPPDPFAVKGQNWGFPTYNWEKMAENHFDWWNKRFVKMSDYFDAFRIDHVLGFFRIWSIPVDSVDGTMGRFVPALPIHVYEFAQRGMWFNYHRLCKPYINDAVLWELFGPNNEKFKPFLEPIGQGQYQLKDEFSTQVKVHEYFSALENSDDNKNICAGLNELIANVILFEEPNSNGQQFHFRIGIESTSSFRHLDWNTQHQLKDLYVDYFFRRQDEFWKKEAMKKLPYLKQATNMMICGEDLGMVPHSVPHVMKELGILSLEIQRMPKDPTREFFHPADAPYLSVVTPSTHDMSTIRGWWEEDLRKTQRFFKYELGGTGDAPTTCEGWINKAIVVQHLFSPAMWSIFQLQDLLGMDESIRRHNHADERINIPAIPKYFWRYRMHMTLEKLLREEDFNAMLRKMISESGR